MMQYVFRIVHIVALDSPNFGQCCLGETHRYLSLMPMSILDQFCDFLLLIPSDLSHLNADALALLLYLLPVHRQSTAIIA
jgi:hypothetical protein